MKAARLFSGRTLLLIVLTVLVLLAWRAGLADLLSFEALKTRQAALSAWTGSHPWEAAALFFVLYVAVAALSLPGAAVMTLAAGAIFGLMQGTLIVSFASSVGATLAMLVARYLLREPLTRRYGERLQRIDSGIARDGAFYLFTLRLVPVFPFFVINLLAGLTALRPLTFYWVSQLGMLPGTIAYVFAGTQLARIASPSDVLSPGLLGAFALLGILPLLLRWLTRWLQARRI